MLFWLVGILNQIAKNIANELLRKRSWNKSILRTYIFGFPQINAVKLGLKVNELLILDYLNKLFCSGISKKEVRGSKRYYRLTYKKILNDLPILNIKERRLREIFTNLENLGLVDRLMEDTKEMYIYVDFDKLMEGEVLSCDESNEFEKIDKKVFDEEKNEPFIFDVSAGRKMPTEVDISAEKCRTPGRKMPTIDNYNNNKILKIKMSKENACATLNKSINISKYNEILKSCIAVKFSQVTKELYLKRFRLLVVEDDTMLFETDYLHILEANYKAKLEDMANLILQQMYGK